MLIANYHRRWVPGNAGACDLLAIADEALPCHTMDDFTSSSERSMRVCYSARRVWITLPLRHGRRPAR